MQNYFDVTLPADDLRAISSIGLAHLGDAVFELLCSGIAAVAYRNVEGCNIASNAVQRTHRRLLRDGEGRKRRRRAGINGSGLHAPLQLWNSGFDKGDKMSFEICHGNTDLKLRATNFSTAAASASPKSATVRSDS